GGVVQEGGQRGGVLGRGSAGGGYGGGRYLGGLDRGWCRGRGRGMLVWGLQRVWVSMPERAGDGAGPAPPMAALAVEAAAAAARAERAAGAGAALRRPAVQRLHGRTASGGMVVRRLVVPHRP